jgi:chromosome segregation ATPase
MEQKQKEVMEQNITELQSKVLLLENSINQLEKANQEEKTKCKCTFDAEKSQLEAQILQRDNKLIAMQADKEKDKQTISDLQSTVTATQGAKTMLEAVQDKLVDDKRTLMAERAALTGMDVVGSSLIECVERFRDLTTNSLLNLLFSLTEDETLQDLLVPQLSHIPTHLLVNIFPLIANRDCIS